MQISIYTSQSFEDLKNYFQKTSHYRVLSLPEEHCHPSTEARKIREFINRCIKDDSPHCEIYTLRETAGNILGHMISEGIVDYHLAEIVIIPEGNSYGYDCEGYLEDGWPFGFYEW